MDEASSQIEITDRRPQAASPESQKASSGLPQSWFWKFALYYVGVLLPFACALLANLGPIDRPSWQDGTLPSQWGFVLQTKHGWPLQLFLLVPAISLGRWFWIGPRRPTWVVRFGIASGIPVAMTYCVLIPIVLKTPIPVYLIGSAIGGGLICLAPIIGGFTSRLGWGKYVAVVVACIFLGSIALAVVGWSDLLSVIVSSPIALLFASVVCAPVWALAVYGFCSYQLIVNQDTRARFTLATIIGAVTWLAGFMAAIRQSILNSHAQYATLPLEKPPQCYIATAAARGHRSIVGSTPGLTVDGESVWVNHQMERLKAAELAIECVSPRIHHRLRSVYNRVGPWLAGALRSRGAADCAYVLLKPAEWIALLSLRITIGSTETQSLSLYRDRIDLPNEH